MSVVGLGRGTPTGWFHLQWLELRYCCLVGAIASRWRLRGSASPHIDLICRPLSAPLPPSPLSRNPAITGSRLSGNCITQAAGVTPNDTRTCRLHFLPSLLRFVVVVAPFAKFSDSQKSGKSKKKRQELTRVETVTTRRDARASSY